MQHFSSAHLSNGRHGIDLAALHSCCPPPSLHCGEETTYLFAFSVTSYHESRLQLCICLGKMFWQTVSHRAYALLLTCAVVLWQGPWWMQEICLVDEAKLCFMSFVLGTFQWTFSAALTVSSLRLGMTTYAGSLGQLWCLAKDEYGNNCTSTGFDCWYQLLWLSTCSTLSET